MTHISGFERSQILLLPEAVDDYVGADNPVRFIDAFVDELDLSAAGFVRVAAKATGRPGYGPADLLKLYIYGYLNRVRSSRRLEMEMTPYVPKPQRGSSVNNGLFRKDEFRYDAARDVYICPAGEALSPNHESKLRDLKKISTTAIRRRARPVRFASRCTTTPTVARSRGWRTRRCSTAWRRD